MKQVAFDEMVSRMKARICGTWAEKEKDFEKKAELILKAFCWADDRKFKGIQGLDLFEEFSRLRSWHERIYYPKSREAENYSENQYFRPLHKNSIYTVFQKDYPNVSFYEKRPTKSFLIHLALALRMDADWLNQLLRMYGYLPLHSKNLYHLSVYSVLCNADCLKNPFLEAEEKYRTALNILTEEQSSLCKTVSEPLFTTVLNQKLYANRQYIGNNDFFYAFVRSNIASMTERRSKIIKEHNRLLAVLKQIYDVETHDKSWSERQQKYSLYSFIMQFCKVSRNKERYGHKTFSTDLQGYIEKGTHIPTREIMIILWFYLACFYQSPKVSCSELYYKNCRRAGVAERFFQKDERNEYMSPTETGIAQPYRFDIHSYLFGETVPAEETAEKSFVWKGRDFVHTVNNWLIRYGWAPLSIADRFDAAFMMLENITITDKTVCYNEGFRNIKDDLSGDEYFTFQSNECPAFPVYVCSSMFEAIQKRTANIDKLLECEMKEPV